MRTRGEDARYSADQAGSLKGMRRIALSALAMLIGLQGCASLSHEKEACQAFVAYPQLAAPPENVAQLYALKSFGRPRKGYHEHWYKTGDDHPASQG
jgi:hypothetical protein